MIYCDPNWESGGYQEATQKQTRKVNTDVRSLHNLNAVGSDKRVCILPIPAGHIQLEDNELADELTSKGAE